MSDEKELLELIAELDRDGIVHPTRRREVAKKRLAQRKAYRELADKSKPLVRALNQAGANVESVWDLVGQAYDCEAIVPVLLANLDEPLPQRTREGLVRALSVKTESRRITGPLIDVFCREHDDFIKTTIGSVLASIGHRDAIGDLISLMEDRSHGQTRISLPHAVANILKEDSLDILIPLLDDPDFGAVVIDALGKLKAVEALPAIRRFANDEDPHIRQHARAALRRIERQPKKSRAE